MKFSAQTLPVLLRLYTELARSEALAPPVAQVLFQKRAMTLPCIVAYYMDVSKHHYTFKTVFAANLSGMMPFITKIIAAGPSSTQLQAIMGDITSWVMIYGAALIGWLLILVCPMVAQALVAGLHQTQFARYDWLQKKLESEWGAEVRQFSGDPHHEHQ